MRWLVLASSILAYAFSVRQIHYGAVSGIAFIDHGAGWHYFAIACALVGTRAGMLVAREDFVRRPNAPMAMRVLGRIALVLGGVLFALELLALLSSSFLWTITLPGARWPT